jgi:hypothetical protein
MCRTEHRRQKNCRKGRREKRQRDDSAFAVSDSIRCHSAGAATLLEASLSVYACVQMLLGMQRMNHIHRLSKCRIIHTYHELLFDGYMRPLFHSHGLQSRW